MQQMILERINSLNDNALNNAYHCYVTKEKNNDTMYTQIVSELMEDVSCLTPSNLSLVKQNIKNILLNLDYSYGRTSYLSENLKEKIREM